MMTIFMEKANTVQTMQKSAPKVKVWAGREIRHWQPQKSSAGHKYTIVLRIAQATGFVSVLSD